MCQIIGRKQEIEELTRACNSNRAEFVAVYGRRRVGKTFLINEVLRDNITFRHTGLSPYDRTRKVTLSDQLQNFHYSLIRYGMEGGERPRNWMEAFFRLEQFLERQDNGSRQVVFIDELPWMDTPRSGFLTALEAFWNGWGSSRHNLCLVVCGSATSWMLDNLINNKGGLYGRLTHEICLHPFSLQECELFFLSRGIKMSRYNIAQAYMILGGIPYYLDYFNPSMSLAQNIDALFFNRRPKLGDEFERLFHSIFDHADLCMEIVRFLCKRHSGYTRNEILAKISKPSNGDLTKQLKALIGSGFISTYTPFGEKRVTCYKLSDNFCRFWLHFKEERKIEECDYWLHHLKESEISAWRGIAFEEVCMQHIDQIKRSLQIAGVSSRESSYILRGENGEEGMQIDLIIDRADDVVNVCEMKFCKSGYVVTKAYAEKIARHIERLEQMIPSKTFLPTLISVSPIHSNEYADTFAARLSLDDLF